MFALLTLLTLLALSATVEEMVCAARRAIACRMARKATTTWHARRPDVRFSLVGRR